MKFRSYLASHLLNWAASPMLVFAFHIKAKARTKDWTLKAKARTKDLTVYVLKDSTRT
jgi:hypothetical protein